MQAAKLLVAAWAAGLFVSDLYARRIPNVLSFGAALFAIGFLLVKGVSVLGASWQSVLLGTGFGLAMTLPAYLMRLLGAGDVKLMLALGLLGGWNTVLISFIVAGLLAGLLAVAVTLLSYYGYIPRSKKWLPFGSLLCLGLLATIGLDP